ncbi:heme-NO-binding protein [Pontibacter ummariensis]|uniref:Haem-NO-binding n=1 Tax=Pontibacter ummariensis TaxID=1610492 RepID=A0A239K1V6_9BACT|nr:heme NO-binding domain-containing protein [Pontibacter ummariensis]PRY06819.1 heme-NO-binding protein [Pontibacter ummariensis]SNT11653.1 Haem-NO-binding [Pontibacter ummariensis]
MHGFIFLQFKKFVQQTHGVQAWQELKDEAQVSRPQFNATEIYPDADIIALVHTAAAKWELPAEVFLEQVGTFLVPDLLDVYQLYINPAWRTLDLVEHTENNMHRAVRVSSPEATPPILHVTRVNAKKLIIDYHSKRRMAALAVGIIKGIAAHYQESDRINIVLHKYSGGERVQIELTYSA